VKLTAKDGKVQQYAALAKYIFTTKPGQSSLYLQNPSRFGTAVKTHLWQCVFLAVHVYISTKTIQSQIQPYWLFKGAWIPEA